MGIPSKSPNKVPFASIAKGNIYCLKTVVNPKHNLYLSSKASKSGGQEKSSKI